MKRLCGFSGREVVHPGGQHLGRFVDLRLKGAPEHGKEPKRTEDTELVYGKIGLIERPGLMHVDKKDSGLGKSGEDRATSHE